MIYDRSRSHLHAAIVTDPMPDPMPGAISAAETIATDTNVADADDGAVVSTSNIEPSVQQSVDQVILDSEIEVMQEIATDAGPSEQEVSDAGPSEQHVPDAGPSEQQVRNVDPTDGTNVSMEANPELAEDSIVVPPVVEPDAQPDAQPQDGQQDLLINPPIDQNLVDGGGPTRRRRRRLPVPRHPNHDEREQQEHVAIFEMPRRVNTQRDVSMPTQYRVSFDFSNDYLSMFSTVGQ